MGFDPMGEQLALARARRKTAVQTPFRESLGVNAVPVHRELIGSSSLCLRVAATRLRSPQVTEPAFARKVESPRRLAFWGVRNGPQRAGVCLPAGVGWLTAGLQAFNAPAVGSIPFDKLRAGSRYAWPLWPCGCGLSARGEKNTPPLPFGAEYSGAPIATARGIGS